MKRIFLIISFLISISFFAQDYNFLKKADTIYIAFKGKNISKRILYQSSYDYNDIYFMFNGLDESVAFFHFKYGSWELKEVGKTSYVKTLNKKDLKKINKHKIITSNFLKNNDLCKVERDILNRFKVLYLLDYTEKRKVVLYEVQISRICPVSE